LPISLRTFRNEAREQSGNVVRPEDAQKTVEAATEQVIKEGGVIHEESLWEANEMALDGVPTDIIVRTIQKPRRNPYRPRGGWSER
jgi:hypothetical protein